jgi:hypothetical protein
MIVGSGSISKMLNDREGFIFFASGVSDSTCTSYVQFERERNLLSYILPTDSHLVYFSSIIVQMKQTAYTEHKLRMEECVMNWFENYTIIRLGNIWEDTNPNTFLNYIKAKQEKGEQVEIRDELKFMISKQQLLFVTDNLPLKGKNTISIFGNIMSAKECVKFGKP